MGWFIAGAFLLLLAAVLSLVVSITISYERDFTVFLRIGWITVPLYPQKEKKKAGENIKEDPSGEENKTEPEDNKKLKKKITRAQIFYALETVPGLVGRILRRVWCRLWLEPLRLTIVVGGEDPADTAILYGKLYGLISEGYRILDHYTVIKEADLRITMDFDAEKTAGAGTVGIRFRVGAMLAAALLSFKELLSWYKGFQAAGKQEQTGTKQSEKG